MEIVKQLNNNIVIASDGQGREAVLMGKGIGFGCKAGMELDMGRVEKQFYGLGSGRNAEQLGELLCRIPLEYLTLGIQIAESMQAVLKMPLNDTFVLLISDHVNFAIERYEKGLKRNNALLWETKKFYPDEFQLALDALDIIERETGIRLPEDEAAFLTMHIVNAQYGGSDSLAQDLIQVIQDVVNLVRYTYGIELDESSLDYIRFVTHLKFFLSRIFTKETCTGSEDLYNIVSVMYPRATACTKKIAAYLRQQLSYSLGLEEEGYLILHIEKLTRK